MKPFVVHAALTPVLSLCLDHGPSHYSTAVSLSSKFKCFVTLRSASLLADNRGGKQEEDEIVKNNNEKIK